MIKVGDKVFLKSGGPEMTVCNIGTFSKIAECRYFNVDKVNKDSLSSYLRTENVPVAALELAKG
jgi:uncharacterized protein YodC (DUF2158 family)